MNTSTISILISCLVAQVCYTTLDVPSLIAGIEPQIRGAIQWQEDTVQTYEDLFPGERSAAARAQWDQRKAATEAALESFKESASNLPTE